MTQRQISELKAEEARLRNEEGILSDRSTDLHEQAQQLITKAEQLELEIIALERQIPNIDPTAWSPPRTPSPSTSLFLCYYVSFNKEYNAKKKQKKNTPLTLLAKAVR